MGSSPFTRTEFMFYVLLTMFAGVGAGWLLRKWKPVKYSGAAVTVVIWLLLFLMGAEIGADRELVRNLSSLGLQALVFAAAGICGSFSDIVQDALP